MHHFWWIHSFTYISWHPRQELQYHISDGEFLNNVVGMDQATLGSITAYDQAISIVQYTGWVSDLLTLHTRSNTLRTAMATLVAYLDSHIQAALASTTARTFGQMVINEPNPCFPNMPTFAAV